MNKSYADAYERQQRCGWIKEAFSHDDGRECMLGALGRAWHFDPHYYDNAQHDTDPALVPLAKVVTEQFPDRLPELNTAMSAAAVIMWFNDDARTTWPEVQMVWEKSIAGEAA